MSAWTNEETIKLIEIWGEEDIQVQLEGCRRNKSVFDGISQGMASAGFSRSPVQCRDKIKKLKTEYKRVKDSNNLTGRERKTTQFFIKLDEILGHRPATRPENVLDTSCPQNSSAVAESPASIDSATVSEDEGMKGHVQADDNVEEENEEAFKPGNGASKSKSDCKATLKRGAQLEKALDSVVQKVAELDEESSVRFWAMERERMEMNQRMMEIEKRRWREDREWQERQRREDREFQIKVLQMLSSQSTVSSTGHTYPTNYYPQTSESNADIPGNTYEW